MGKILLATYLLLLSTLSCSSQTTSPSMVAVIDPADLNPYLVVFSSDNRPVNTLKVPSKLIQIKYNSNGSAPANNAISGVLDLGIGFSAQLTTAATGVIQIIPIYAFSGKGTMLQENWISKKLFFDAISSTTVLTGQAVNAQTINGSVTLTQTPVAPVPTYTINGSISGLSATGLILQNNGNETLEITSGAISFAFSGRLNNGAAYAVTASAQPAGQICTLSSGVGIVSGSNISSVSINCVINKRMFVTASSYHGGDLGGISGADSLCMSDSNKPSDGATYKAFLVDGSTRIACTTTNCAGGSSEHTDWVLAGSTTYTRADDSVVIGTTTSAGIFTFPLSAASRSTTGHHWAGLTQTWTSNSGDCTGWTSEAGNTGSLAEQNTNARAIASASEASCGVMNSYQLLCVEQ